jgi:hypothetical protein
MLNVFEVQLISISNLSDKFLKCLHERKNRMDLEPLKYKSAHNIFKFSHNASIKWQTLIILDFNCVVHITMVFEYFKCVRSNVYDHKIKISLMLLIWNSN